MLRKFVALGSLNALLAVALGAFGAHGLKDRLSEDMLDVYQTGVHYHTIHALGLILIGLLAERLHEAVKVKWAGRLLFAGIVLFSGSLYVLSLSGVKLWGIVTPFGGVAFLAGWVLLGMAAWNERTDT